MAVFKDVPDNYPNQAEIEALAQAGIIKGVQRADGLYYEPERAVSRRELAVILSRINVTDRLRDYIYPQGQGAAPEAEVADAGIDA
jgi:hypothetical protein